MKHLITLAFCAVIGLLPAQAGTFADEVSEKDSLLLHYGGSPSSTQKGTGYSSQIGAALEFPAEKLAPYKGNKITGIRFYVNRANSISDIQGFVSRKLGETPLSTENVQTVQTSQWNLITFETPVEITGDSLFIGYQMQADEYPLAMRVSGDEPTLGDWYYEGEKWSHANKSNGTYVFAIQMVIKGENIPLYNAEFTQITLPTYVKTDSAYQIKGYITNKGVREINSLEIAYGAEGKDKTTSTVEGLSILSGDGGAFEIPDFKANAAGDQEIIFEITKVNNNEDWNPADNTAVGSIIARDHFTRRKVLVENNTSESCPSCPSAHKSLDQACEGKENLVRLEHHAGFVEDKFSLPQSWEIFTHFSPTYSFAPGLMVDRTNLDAYGTTPPFQDLSTPIFDISYKNKATLQQWIESVEDVPALVQLEIKTTYNEEDRSAVIQVKGNKLDIDLIQEMAYLTVCITEDSVFTSNQTSGGKEYYHNHMARVFLTPAFGDEIQMDQPFEKEYTASIPENWKLKDLTVVAFMGNYDPKDLNNSLVYNSEWAPLYVPDGIYATETTNNLYVYNAGNGRLHIQGEYERAEAYTLSGTCIATASSDSHELNVGNQPQGVIIVKLYHDKGVKSCKVVL